MIRVGKALYDNKGIKTDPSYPNYEKIVVIMKSHSKYYPLSPYYLKDENEVLMENYWQFSKIYRQVPKSLQKRSRYDSTIIWDHPKEDHIIKINGIDKITNEYIEWRKKGMKCPDPIRYPVGFNYRQTCYGALKCTQNEDTIDETKILDYVEARKQIYVKKYCDLVKKEPLFLELQKKLKKGINLLIVDVDGPHQESLDYYKNNYNVSNNFIENHTVLMNQEAIKIFLNDTKHSFGHGYCLAMALLNKDIEWND